LEPPSCDPFHLFILLADFPPAGFWIPLFSIIVLMILSAFFSGSEVAFFSLTPTQIDSLRTEDTEQNKKVLNLLEVPDRAEASRILLATILIANNLVNVAIILLSAYVTPYLFTNPQDLNLFGWVITAEYVSFSIQVVAVTFFLVLFGEVIPKVYATNNNITLARMMAGPISVIRKLFLPVSKMLVTSSGFIEKRLSKSKSSLSVSDLSHALELTQDDDRSEEEHKILQGIVSFGSKDVKQIMTARMDVTAFPEDTPFLELLKGIIDAGYSRVPIYTQSIDEIIGILYIKDLLPYTHEDNVDWKSLLRSPFVVPENKKIDDLLREFQSRKTHVAIVVDEYGGTLGLVTLEDVIEEIVGDITDEFDDEGINYSKISTSTYVFQGKTALIDLYRILDVDGTPFEAAKGESDTLAGFIIEQFGKIPLRGEQINFENLSFTVEAADKRKVNQVKVRIRNEEDED